MRSKNLAIAIWQPCLHVLKGSETGVAQVEHHVAHNALDKVGLEVKVWVEEVVVVLKSGHIRVKGREDARL